MAKEACCGWRSFFLHSWSLSTIVGENRVLTFAGGSDEQRIVCFDWQNCAHGRDEEDEWVDGGKEDCLELRNLDRDVLGVWRLCDVFRQYAEQVDVESHGLDAGVEHIVAAVRRRERYARIRPVERLGDGSSDACAA